MILDLTDLNGEAKRLSEYLKSRIISQHEAIDSVCVGAQKYFVGLNEIKKPLGTFLFAGPTGTGKTKVVQDIGKFFDIEPVVINCGEMQQHHELSKLLGAPPGFIGHGETKPLISKERIENTNGRPNVVLFDEIEKASSALFNLLLGILDNGYVTTNHNVNVYFNNCFIFMTCNIGIEKLEQENKNIGFSKKELSKENKEEITFKEIKKVFRPEFINRIEKIVVFEALTKQNVEDIFELELSDIQDRLSDCEMKKVFLYIDPSAKQKIVDMGYSAEYGARNLKRIMEKEIVCPVSNALSLEQVEDGDSILVEFVEDAFLFRKQQYTRKKGSSTFVMMDKLLR
jgi:ATP-dependent Clp protease ATP-binding subunit ClpA